MVTFELIRKEISFMTAYGSETRNEIYQSLISSIKTLFFPLPHQRQKRTSNKTNPLCLVDKNSFSKPRL